MKPTHSTPLVISNKPRTSEPHDNPHVKAICDRAVMKRRRVEESLERKRLADELGINANLIGL